MKKILTAAILTAVILLTGAIEGLCAPGRRMDADIKTKRLPAGTIIPLKMLDAAGSGISMPGSSFDLSAAEDIKAEDAIVIPKGSLVRGTVEEVKPAKRLYKGGVIRLYFDHIVSTSGRQVPFTAGICNNPYAVFDGALSSKTTYSDAFEKTVKNTKNIVVKPVNMAWEKGGDLWNGFPKYVFAPVTAVVCAPIAGLYFIGDTIADIFKKGEEITVNQGGILYVQLIKPLDMPVY